MEYTREKAMHPGERMHPNERMHPGERMHPNERMPQEVNITAMVHDNGTVI